MPGHGKSDKFYTHAAYDLKFMVDDVVAVLNDLGIEQTHYWGYSMGGFIGFGLAKYYSHRVHSLILGGASPYHDPTQPNPFLSIMQRGVEEGAEAMIEGYRTLFGGTIHPTSAARLRSVDPRAMVAFFEFSPDEKGLEDVLPTMTMPCLLYVGDQDDPDHVLNYAKQMPNVATLVLPGLNHGQTSAAVDLIVPRALEFLTTGK
ncbi:MAG: alpha/beta hydrolase [Caldilineaceae bacterium]